jgi:hypothetical protein
MAASHSQLPQRPQVSTWWSQHRVNMQVGIANLRPAPAHPNVVASENVLHQLFHAPEHDYDVQSVVVGIDSSELEAGFAVVGGGSVDNEVFVDCDVEVWEGEL